MTINDYTGSVYISICSGWRVTVDMKNPRTNRDVGMALCVPLENTCTSYTRDVQKQGSVVVQFSAIHGKTKLFLKTAFLSLAASDVFSLHAYTALQPYLHNKAKRSWPKGDPLCSSYVCISCASPVHSQISQLLLCSPPV